MSRPTLDIIAGAIGILGASFALVERCINMDGQAKLDAVTTDFHQVESQLRACELAVGGTGSRELTTHCARPRQYDNRWSTECSLQNSGKTTLDGDAFTHPGSELTWVCQDDPTCSASTWSADLTVGDRVMSFSFLNIGESLSFFTHCDHDPGRCYIRARAKDVRVLETRTDEASVDKTSKPVKLNGVTLQRADDLSDLKKIDDLSDLKKKIDDLSDLAKKPQ